MTRVVASVPRRFDVRAILLRVILVVLVPLVVVGAPSNGAAQDVDGAGPVYVVQVTGTIDLGLAPYLDRVLGEAERAGAAAVVIEIDTPGGRLDAVIQMRDSIIDSPLRTIALVDSTAFSAGALVAIASNEIYMTPGSVMGAATPVLGGTGEVADEKTISAVRATFEAAAEENGRDPIVAAAMVDTSIAIDGLVDEGQLLTLTVSQAVEFGYADGVVANLSALLSELGLADRELVETSPSFAESIVRFVTNPLLAGLLLLGGLLLIVGDFFSGGVGVAALAGVGLLAVFFWGHLLAGLAGWEDVALVVIGVALIAVEVFVLPGFGVAGILGLVSLGAGTFLAMLYRDFDFVRTDDLVRAGTTVVLSLLGAVIGFVALLVFVSRRGPLAGLVLHAGSGDATPLPDRTSSGWLGWFDGDARLESDRRPSGPAPVEERSLVGATGVAVSDLRPAGVAEIEGERVDVVTSGELVPRGAPIEVVRDERYRRVVRQVASPVPPTP